jgi:hypothetical protein
MAGQSCHTTTPNPAETEVGMSTPQTDKYGNREWRNSEGELHRTDGPAVERADGSREWYLNGLLHREDGPARELANSRRAWYQNGQLHRTDGPAVEWASGTRMWCRNGQQHREDGPAIERADGTREWWLNKVPLTFEQWLDKAAATPQHQTLLRLRWA